MRIVTFLIFIVALFIVHQALVWIWSLLLFFIVHGNSFVLCIIIVYCTHATELSVDSLGFYGQMITDVHAPSGHVPMAKRLSFTIEFEIQDTAHTVDSNDPDLEAFKSNLRAIIRAREGCRISFQS